MSYSINVYKEVIEERNGGKDLISRSMNKEVVLKITFQHDFLLFQKQTNLSANIADYQCLGGWITHCFRY